MGFRRDSGETLIAAPNRFSPNIMFGALELPPAGTPRAVVVTHKSPVPIKPGVEPLFLSAQGPEVRFLLGCIASALLPKPFPT